MGFFRKRLSGILTLENTDNLISGCKPDKKKDPNGARAQ